MEREPQPINFPKTELAEIPTDPLSYQFIFYKAVGKRYPGKVYINDNPENETSGTTKVMYNGGTELLSIRRDIGLTQFGLSHHGLPPLIQDVSAGNWRGILFYIQNGEKKYFESKGMENMSSGLSQKDALGLFIAACDRMTKSGGDLPQDIENIYAFYRKITGPTTQAILVEKLSLAMASVLRSSKIAA